MNLAGWPTIVQILQTFSFFVFFFFFFFLSFFLFFPCTSLFFSASSVDMDE